MAALAIGTYALKSAGPLLLGNRRLPTWFETIVNRLPAALLAALVVTSAFASKGRLVLDARAVGLAAAMLALSRRAGFITVVIVAAATTALARQLGMT
jgi:branched-subunit amino acid transport protein